MKQQLIDRFPGISCAWAGAEGKETTECRGFSDKESHAPVNEKTMFPACSISKFITAICIMKLQEQELIDIDTPVNRFLRQWKLLTADGAESGVIILCHIAGIVDEEDSFYGLRMSDPEISLLDILEGRTSYNRRPVRTEKPRGTAFEYSDAGYCVLQLLMEEVTQKAFDESVWEILFDPLG